MPDPGGVWRRRRGPAGAWSWRDGGPRADGGKHRLERAAVGKGRRMRAPESGLEPAGRTAKEQRVPRPSPCKSHGTKCFSAQDAEEG